MLQKLANTSSVRESYMMPLNSFVQAHNDELKVSGMFSHTLFPWCPFIEKIIIRSVIEYHM